MKIKFNEKYNTISIYVILVFTVCLILSMVVENIPNIFGYLGKIISVMSPIICGIVIAYLLNPLMNFIEKRLKPKFFKDNSYPTDISKLNDAEKFKFKKKKRTLRAISVAICVSIAIITLIAIVAMVIPELIDSISGLFNNFPYYLYNMNKELTALINKYPDLNSTLIDWLTKQITTIRTEALKLLSELKPQFNSIMEVITEGVSGFFGGLKNFLIGLIISIYLLYGKEEFIAQIRKGMFAIFPNNICKGLLTIGSKTNSIFLDFLVGKAVDSLIIGVICFIVLSIMKMPYTVLISIIIGITNMIPFFGPFIGAIPSAILVLLSEPKQTIAFIIFIVILQQIDGNIIGPKILGNKMGLSTFWIMFAILVFGGLFNIVGMFIGVPLFTMLYILANSFIEDRLKAKNMPMDKRYYGKVTVNEEEISFPEKEDYSDEDINEENIPKEDTPISRIKDKIILFKDKVLMAKLTDLIQKIKQRLKK